MNNEDLEYIYKKIPYKEENIYPKIMVSTQNLHIDFLKSSNINYDVKETQNRKIKDIHILRLDGSLLNTVTNPNYPTNSKLGIRLAGNKLKTEEYLKNFNLKTTNSKIYNMNELEKAKIESFSNNKKEVVIKPLNGTMGRGVMVNVKEERFDQCWEYTSAVHNSKSSILVQDYLEGFEARVNIMEGKIVAIVLRVPPFVIGNGKDSLCDLIREKNIRRAKCGYLKNMPIDIDEKISEFLKSKNANLSDIPKDGEYFLLSSVSNISNGGELIDITDLVSQEIKDFSLNVLAAMPGLYTGGLDIMIKSFDDISPTLIEVNTFPVIALPTYPTYGPSRNPSKYYYESIVVLDQLRNNPKYKYNIEDEEKYLTHYLNFNERKMKLLNKNYITIKDYFL